MSIWLDYYKDNKEKELNKNINTDVLIIGGGITGLSIAYNLINKNLKVILVEKNKLYCGVTSKTTGKITYLQENLYSKINNYVSYDASKLYYKSQKDAIDILINTIKNNNINCDLEKVSSYLFINDIKKRIKLEKEYNLLKSFGANIEKTCTLPDEDKCILAIKVDDTYVFNPIKYLYELTNICKNNNINIYENTKIEKIELKNNFYQCYTANNTIKAKYVVLALHYPYFSFPFFMPTKVYLEKSYIGVKKHKNNYKYSAINIGKPSESIRYYSDNKDIFKIKLYKSHNIAINNNDSKNFSSLNKNLDYKWSNIDIITNDYLPFIGKIKNNLLIATGFNTWGMTNSALSGKIISDIILKNKNKYINLFNPKRHLNIAKIINFPLIISSNILSMISSKLKPNKHWYNNNPKFKTINGKKIAIYTDKSGKEHTVLITCPHLKCNLIFNKTEHTWDCPCHGSRFNVDGKSIEGPSNYDISYNCLNDKKKIE